MTIRVLGSTRVYGIVGDPITHSRSPVMQNAAFQKAGINAVYVPFQVAPDALKSAVDGLRALGVAGWNVTIPHKNTIMPFLDELSGEAQIAGAVNVVLNRDGCLIGHNTDGMGLVASLARDLDCSVKGKQIVVLGSGGAARGAVAALAGAGAAGVTVVNRTYATAVRLVSELSDKFQAIVFKAYSFEELSQILPMADILINTTSVGMRGEEIIGLQLELLPNDAKVYDMVYGTVDTPLVRSARMAGLAAANGLGMLVAQGELAFEIWTGSPPPPGVMRSALDMA